jgi:hypothetical protein
MSKQSANKMDLYLVRYKASDTNKKMSEERREERQAAKEQSTGDVGNLI